MIPKPDFQTNPNQGLSKETNIKSDSQFRKPIISVVSTVDQVVSEACEDAHTPENARVPETPNLQDIPEEDSCVEPEILSLAPNGVKDLDSEDIGDPSMAAEYADEIFEYLYDLEANSIPNPQYMSHQDNLDWNMRGILINWLIEVHSGFNLVPDSLFLAINIIDRFLSKVVVQLSRLQLLGIAAMFIAAKYEQVHPPRVANFKHVADDNFSEAEILSAERVVLTTLDYDFSYPSPMNFLRRISKADDYDIQSRTLGKCLMEISLLDHRFMKYRPSRIAAAAMYLARLILERGEWVIYYILSQFACIVLI